MQLATSPATHLGPLSISRSALTGLLLVAVLLVTMVVSVELVSAFGSLSH